MRAPTPIKYLPPNISRRKRKPHGDLSHQVIFIYIAHFTIQILSKQLYSDNKARKFVLAVQQL